MIQNSIKWSQKHEWFIVLVLLLTFILIRLPGVNSPLHQDEYKWPVIVNPATANGVEIPHPPIGEFIYRTAGEIIGFNVHFRFVPLFFGAINLLMLYYFLRMNFGRLVAIIGATLFTLSYFSILASLMVDTDGQIIPFFFLLALIGYGKSQISSGKKRISWLVLLAVASILGFFVKVSFALVICAITADWLWGKKSQMTKKDVLEYLGYGFGGILILIILLFLSQYVFNFFNLSKALAYWEHFANLNRNWFQTGIQVVKAILYTSPFILFVPFFLSKEDIKKIRPFLLYIIFGMIFYTILFDFSIGALDRYLQFLIIPLCAISAVVIVSVMQSGDNKRNREYIFLGTIFALILFMTVFVPHFVPSLQPKSAWISRALSLKWNFLYPFFGGSGPLGFYVSFLFMALSWIVSVILIAIGLIKPHLRKMVILILIPIGLAYNLTFTEEYLFGKINGSAPKLLNGAVEFIKNDQVIKSVIVYNDNGGNEIQNIGKYKRRLYLDPMFFGQIDYMNQNKGFYFVLDVPRIDPESLYVKYFNSCKIVYKEIDKKMSATIYDCKNVPDVKS